MDVTNIFIFIFALYNALFLITYYFFWKKVNKLFRKCENLFYSWEIFEDGFEKRKKLIEENKILIQEIDELKLKFSTPLNKVDFKNLDVNICEQDKTKCINVKPTGGLENSPIVFYETRDLTKIQPIENFCDIPPLKPKKTFKRKTKKK